MNQTVFLVVITSFILCLCNCKKDEYKNLDCSKINSTYAASIKPIIDANCLSSGCHEAGSPNGNYLTYEGLKLRVDNGTLSKKVLYDKTMPKNSSLSTADRDKIKCWINGGALKN